MALGLRSPLAHLLRPLFSAPAHSPTAPPVLRRLHHPILPSIQLQIPRAAIPIVALAGVSSTLQGLWESIKESILRAVPKKKTSHMKKRHRYMANGNGKLKDVTALNKCSGCGRPKRAHLLCPYCVNGMIYFRAVRNTANKLNSN